MPVLSKVRRPFTPGRLANFLESLLPSARKATSTKPDARQASPTKIGRSSATGLPSVALQNEDNSSDAVIITTLPVPPFCCHEDLVSMDRVQVERVARALNDRLPAALQIDLSPHRSEAYIRNSIELAVGLRTRRAPPPGSGRQLKTARVGGHANKGHPAAPSAKAAKHARSKSFDVGALLLGPRLPVTPPRRAQPAHKRARSAGGLAYGLYTTGAPHGPTLEILEEDEEEGASADDGPAARPVKKRRVDGALPPINDTSSTPTPAARMGMHRRTPSFHGGTLPGVPAPPPIYRPTPAGMRRCVSAHGAALGLGPRPKIDLDAAARVRYRPKPRLGQTSTPRRVTPGTFSSSSSIVVSASGVVTDSSPEALRAPDATARLKELLGTPTRCGMKRKAPGANDGELTFGIDGMTISMAVSSADLMEVVEG